MTGPAPLYVSLVAYLVAGVAAGIARRRPEPCLSAVSLLASAAGLGLQLMFLVARTVQIGFLPFASQFEAMTLFALLLEAAGFIVYLSTRQNSAKLGADIAVVLLLGAALLPVGFHPGKAMNAILNSPWFAFHILAAFAAYACLTLGLAWSIASVCDPLLEANRTVLRRLALTGLLLLGAGILSGAAWADVSWGIYWSWDPKESWALLTWAFVMTGLHLRMFNQPGKRWTAVLCFGVIFVTMMFTFVGINLLKWGLHRY
jgi:ABC-type transport system involved in cytochrome c biogenesis permease subunit